MTFQDVERTLRQMGDAARGLAAIGAALRLRQEALEVHPEVARRLAQIAQRVGRINLFHYDSDKSISGRIFACNIALERMSKGDVLVLDDVNDNDHLLSLSNQIGRAPTVFTTKYKSIGLFMM